MKGKLKAWNTCSTVEVDGDMLAACSKDTDIKEVKDLLSSSILNLICFLKFVEVGFFSFFCHFQKKKAKRIARSDRSLVITAVPDRVVQTKKDITLSVTSSDDLSDSSKRYKWECSK